jgi:hypothetical protein
VLVGAFGAGVAFLLDAGTFAFSAAMLLLMRGTRAPARDPLTPRRSAWAEAKEGLRYGFARRWLWVGMVAATISLLCTWGPWEALVPFLVKNELGGGAGALGLVFAAGGVGAVASAALLGQRELPRRPFTWAYWAWAISAFGIMALGLVQGLWQAMLVSLVTESGITILLVYWFTIVQRLVPGSMLGRVSSLDWLISVAGVPLSFAIVGPLAGAIGVRTTLVLAGAIGGAVILLFFYLVPGSRDPERDGSLVRARVPERRDPPG